VEQKVLSNKVCHIIGLVDYINAHYANTTYTISKLMPKPISDPYQPSKLTIYGYHNIFDIIVKGKGKVTTQHNHNITNVANMVAASHIKNFGLVELPLLPSVRVAGVQCKGVWEPPTVKRALPN
jgi:hypothetical protein